jgi:hypothetical protein
MLVSEGVDVALDQGHAKLEHVEGLGEPPAFLRAHAFQSSPPGD